MTQFKDEKQNLILLIEEMGEVIQVCTKALRFGIDSPNPTSGLTNRELLEVELGDVNAIIGILMENKTIRSMELAKNELKKLRKLEDWYV